MQPSFFVRGVYLDRWTHQINYETKLISDVEWRRGLMQPEDLNKLGFDASYGNIKVAPSNEGRKEGNVTCLFGLKHKKMGKST